MNIEEKVIKNEIETVQKNGMKQFQDKGYLIEQRIFSVDDNEEFRKYWNNLAIDQYIESDFKYRRRSYSKMEFDRASCTLKTIGSTYYQEPEHNELYGGLKREFELGQHEFLSDNNLTFLVKTDYDFFNASGLLSQSKCEIGIHQMRTVVEHGREGIVTPEGVHKDGHPVFAIHLINRSDISNGETILYDNDMKFVDKFTLTKFGDTVFIDDNKLYHEVTPISLNVESESRFGYRDILIIEFY